MTKECQCEGCRLLREAGIPDVATAVGSLTQMFSPGGVLTKAGAVGMILVLNEARREDPERFVEIDAFVAKFLETRPS